MRRSKLYVCFLLGALFLAGCSKQKENNIVSISEIKEDTDNYRFERIDIPEGMHSDNCIRAWENDIIYLLNDFSDSEDTEEKSSPLSLSMYDVENDVWKSVPLEEPSPEKSADIYYYAIDVCPSGDILYLCEFVAADGDDFQKQIYVECLNTEGEKLASWTGKWEKEPSPWPIPSLQCTSDGTVALLDGNHFYCFDENLSLLWDKKFSELSSDTELLCTGDMIYVTEYDENLDVYVADPEKKEMSYEKSIELPEGGLTIIFASMKDNSPFMFLGEDRRIYLLDPEKDEVVRSVSIFDYGMDYDDGFVLTGEKGFVLIPNRTLTENAGQSEEQLCLLYKTQEDVPERRKIIAKGDVWAMSDLFQAYNLTHEDSYIPYWTEEVEEGEKPDIIINPNLSTAGIGDSAGFDPSAEFLPVDSYVEKFHLNSQWTEDMKIDGVLYDLPIYVTSDAVVSEVYYGKEIDSYEKLAKLVSDSGYNHLSNCFFNIVTYNPEYYLNPSNKAFTDFDTLHLLTVMKESDEKSGNEPENQMFSWEQSISYEDIADLSGSGEKRFVGPALLGDSIPVLRLTWSVAISKDTKYQKEVEDFLTLLYGTDILGFESGLLKPNFSIEENLAHYEEYMKSIYGEEARFSIEENLAPYDEYMESIYDEEARSFTEVEKNHIIMYYETIEEKPIQRDCYFNWISLDFLKEFNQETSRFFDGQTTVEECGENLQKMVDEQALRQE